MTNVSQAATPNSLDESKLVADLFQGGVPFVVAVLIRHNQLGALLAARPDMRDEFADEFIGNEANDHCHWNR